MTPQSVYQSARTVCLSFGLTLLDQTFLEGDTSLVILKPTRPRYSAAVSIITEAKNDKDVIEFFLPVLL